MSTEREIHAAVEASRKAGCDLEAYRHPEGVVRVVMPRSCSLAENQAAPVAADGSISMRGVVGERMYATNGHVLIDVDSIEGLELIKAHPRVVIGERAERLTRQDTPIERSETLTIRRFTGDGGDIIANARYTTIIEDLFPGVEWYAATLGPWRHMHAVVEGHLVAVLMPLRPSVVDPSVPS